ncbi:hypothetical protein ACWCQ1_49630 [Streptomyces sp. NPDC002144]|uniref:hypothetical protein n=1 Tax=Streptomyces sp. NPDC006668 TaxID=3156903 RepID=UPI003403BDDF
MTAPRAKDLRDVVLVGHSCAGVTIPRVLDLIPDRIRHVVLVSVVVPPDSSRVLDQIDPEARGLVEQFITEAFTKSMTRPPC